MVKLVGARIILLAGIAVMLFASSASAYWDVGFYLGYSNYPRAPYYTWREYPYQYPHYYYYYYYPRYYYPQYSYSYCYSCWTCCYGSYGYYPPAPVYTWVEYAYYDP